VSVEALVDVGTVVTLAQILNGLEAFGVTVAFGVGSGFVP